MSRPSTLTEQNYSKKERLYFKHLTLLHNVKFVLKWLNLVLCRTGFVFRSLMVITCGLKGKVR